MKKKYKIRVDNTSGVPGVHQNSLTKKWIARKSNNGEMEYFGSYKTKEEAIEAL